MQPTAMLMRSFHHEECKSSLPAINFRTFRNLLLLKNWPVIKEIIHEEHQLIDFVLSFQVPTQNMAHKWPTMNKSN